MNAAMQRYISQLLIDLEASACNAPVANNYRARHPFEREDNDDQFGQRHLRLQELFGLPVGIFPPVERLTKSQVTLVLKALEKLWDAWYIDWDFPPTLTARRRYTLMVEYMERELVLFHPDFGAEVDFCSNRAAGTCPFADSKQCWCAEIDACAKREDDSDGSSTTAKEQEKTSPLADFERWLNRGKHTTFFFDDSDEAETGWQAIFMPEDTRSWLYFFDPQRGRDMMEYLAEPSADDFDDFEWDSDHDNPEPYELPF